MQILMFFWKCASHILHQPNLFWSNLLGSITRWLSTSRGSHYQQPNVDTKKIRTNMHIRILAYNATQHVSYLITHKTIYKTSYLVYSEQIDCIHSWLRFSRIGPNKQKKINLINQPTTNFKTHGGFDKFWAFSNITHSEMKCGVDVKQYKKPKHKTKNK